MNLKNCEFNDNFVKYSIDNLDGVIKPLVFQFDDSYGVTLMNPSIFNNGGQLLCTIRCVNYLMHHSESGEFPTWSGPLQYIHPEDDVRLATENFLVELNSNLDIIKVEPIIMMEDHIPQWDFHGLEDLRIDGVQGNIVRVSGVRRDTTPNGEGRIEISLLDRFVPKVAREFDRVRTESIDGSYCEKNWMPILDQVNRYIRWADNTQIIEVDPNTGTSSIIKESSTRFGIDLRGGSQVIRYKEYYLAICHTMSIWKPLNGVKDSEYKSVICIWDKEFNPIGCTDPFHFMDTKIEFCNGMAIHEDKILISFSVMDNIPYILSLTADKLISTLL